MLWSLEWQTFFWYISCYKWSEGMKHFVIIACQLCFRIMPLGRFMQTKHGSFLSATTTRLAFYRGSSPPSIQVLHPLSMHGFIIYCSGHYSWNCVFYYILLARRLDYILQADFRRLELENKTQTSVQLMGSTASPFSGGSVNSVDIAVGQNTRQVRKLGWGRGSWLGGNEESVGGCISEWWHARELNPRLL